VALVLALTGTLLLGTGAAAALGDTPSPTPGFPTTPEEYAAMPPPGANDWGCKPTAAHPRPVVLVHGLGATMWENWNYLSPQIKAAGYCVFALTYGARDGIPYFGGVIPVEQSAAQLDAFVHRVLDATGASQIDLVGHSEGTVMPQWWLKKLGGAPLTHSYVALTPLYQGTTLGGLSTLFDIARDEVPGWKEGEDAFTASACGSCLEMLSGSDFYDRLYSDGTVAAPGVSYTTIMTRFDEAVTPYTSGILYGPQATNIVIQDLCPLHLDEHGLVAFDPLVATLILNALDPAHAVTPSCGTVGLGIGPFVL
jgi:pimeloyl-ACP methyl ester carboxylesterase